MWYRASLLDTPICMVPLRSSHIPACRRWSLHYCRVHRSSGSAVTGLFCSLYDILDKICRYTKTTYAYVVRELYGSSCLIVEDMLLHIRVHKASHCPYAMQLIQGIVVIRPLLHMLSLLIYHRRCCFCFHSEIQQHHLERWPVVHPGI